MNTLLEMPSEKVEGAPIQNDAKPPPRILLVDDDICAREFNAGILIRFGYLVNTAEDGDAGWTALNADDYDLLITDNQMPKVSGIELLKKLRTARMVLPVIMATGVLPSEEFDRYPWIKPAAILVKPYTIGELLRTVLEVLRAYEDGGVAIAPPPSE